MVQKISPPAQPQQTQHKKLALFNRRVDSSLEPPKRIIQQEEEEDDGVKIQFIKPKTKVIGLERKNSMNSVEKSKLSMMLSCLSGDLDEPDFTPKKVSEKPVEPVKLVEQPAASISFATTTTTTNVTPITAPAQTTAGTNKKINGEQVSVGFQMTVAAKTADSTDGKKSEDPAAKPELPKFSFGTQAAPTISIPSVSSSTSTSQEKQVSFSIPTTSSVGFTLPSSGFTLPKPSATPEEVPISTEQNKENPTVVTTAPSISFSSPSLSTGGLSFLGSKLNTSTSTLEDQNKSLISFNTPVKPAEPTLMGFSVPTTSTNSGGFNFGVTGSSSATSNIATSASAGIGSTMTFGNSGGFSNSFGSGGILSGISTNKNAITSTVAPTITSISFTAVTSTVAAPSITSTGFFSSAPQSSNNQIQVGTKFN
jgi:hypothetical protein